MVFRMILTKQDLEFCLSFVTTSHGVRLDGYELNVNYCSITVNLSVVNDLHFKSLYGFNIKKAIQDYIKVVDIMIRPRLSATMLFKVNVYVFQVELERLALKELGDRIAEFKKEIGYD